MVERFFGLLSYRAGAECSLVTAGCSFHINFPELANSGNLSTLKTVQFVSANLKGSTMLPRKESGSMSMIHNSRGAEINVTPLIDVLLVLLIIFMVIQPHHNLGEEADIPKPAPTDVKQPLPENPIVVQLQDQGEGVHPSLAINQERVSWEKLEPQLRSILQVRGDKVAFVKGDAGLEFQYVAEVIDITHDAGAERVGLLSDSHPLGRQVRDHLEPAQDKPAVAERGRRNR